MSKPRTRGTKPAPPPRTHVVDADEDAAADAPLTVGDIDRELVHSTNRVGIWTTGAIALFVVALLRGYPFPKELGFLRGPFYTLVGVALTITALVLLFLGYRFLSLRVVRRVRTIYPTFLPTVALGSFALGLLLMAAPGLR